MTPELITHIGRRTMETALMLAGPILGVTLVVGFLIAMLQAVTSIRDMTMGMVVKLLAVGATALLLGGWMMTVAVSFTAEMFGHMRGAGG